MCPRATTINCGDDTCFKPLTRRRTQNDVQAGTHGSQSEPGPDCKGSGAAAVVRAHRFQSRLYGQRYYADTV